MLAKEYVIPVIVLLVANRWTLLAGADEHQHGHYVFRVQENHHNA